jgi:hypothetical protein
MSDAPKKSGLMITGAVVALIGILAIAVPVFTTEQTREVAKIGDLKLTAAEQTSHVIPRFVGPAVLGIGVVLIGAGLVARR